MRYFSVFAVLVVFSGACIDLPEIEQVSEPSDAGEPGPGSTDASTWTPDASVPDSGIPDSGTPTLAVTLETSRSITNSDVQISARVIGPVPEEVELLADGVAVATLSPPYELRWSAEALVEGTHVLSVRATLGERKVTSESRTLIVDRTAPRLISQSPLTGAQSVSVHQTIQAAFSEPLEPTSVNSESVKLLSGAGVVAAEVLLTSEGTSLTLRPVSLLPADTAVRVSLGTLVDLAGNAVQALPHDWEWMVPGYLALGEPLSASPTESSEVRSPALQVDGTGRPVVAWWDETATEPAGIRVRQWNGSAWVQLEGVLQPTSGHFSGGFSSLKVDGDGQLFVAWDEASNSEGLSLQVRRWSGTAWVAVGGSVGPLPQQTGMDLIVFQVGRQGQPVLAFRESNQGATVVSVWRWNGGSWGLLGGKLKVNSSRLISSLRMNVDAAGNPVVAWSETDDGNLAAYMRRWNGGAWEAIPMPTQTHPGTLSIDDSGAPILDVPVSNGTASSTQLRRWNGSSWVALGNPISAYPGATDSRVTALTSDAQGRLTALISEPEVAGGPSVLYLRRWNDGAWESVGSPLRKTPGSTPVGATLLAVDPTGQPVVARAEQSDSEPGQRRLHVYTPNH
ncbi:Ig-like domain-containing protein [Pyxidicoccus sp. 3LFB2]